MKSQCEMILRDLQYGKRITPLDALRDYGCLRLGARIWDLRHAGHVILDETITLQNKKKVACYYMATGMKVGEQAKLFTQA